MATFTIKYREVYEREDETVEAEEYVDEGDWITFKKTGPSGGYVQVLRVRGGEVHRIERGD